MLISPLWSDILGTTLEVMAAIEKYLRILSLSKFKRQLSLRFFSQLYVNFMVIALDVRPLGSLMRKPNPGTLPGPVQPVFSTILFGQEKKIMKIFQFWLFGVDNQILSQQTIF